MDEKIYIKTLAETAPFMTDTDHTKRLIGEYAQLELRIQGLTKVVEDYKANTLSFEPTSDLSIYEAQLSAMQAYHMALTCRIVNEGLDLNTVQVGD